MIVVKVAFTESEHQRMWGTYWLFWRKVRYGKRFITILLGGAIITCLLQVFLNPEFGFAPLLAVFFVLICLSSVVCVFDYYKYRTYINEVIKHYHEKVANNEYELRFNEAEFFINGRGEEWKWYKYYFINGTDIYLFTSKHKVSSIWSRSCLGEDAFDSMALYAIDNLKILPASRQIWLKSVPGK